VQAARAAAAQGEPVAKEVSLYETMRHVFSQPKEADRTQPQRECRAWLKDDRKGFMAKLADLEKAALAGREKPPEGDGSGPENSGPDEGSARVEELIQRLLDQANQDAEAPVKDGRCMTCGRPVNSAG
jgi:hypothetical protein